MDTKKEMKHAILITAYKDFDQLFNLARLFYDRFGIYIHIDRKSNPQPKAIDAIKSLPQVREVSFTYTVNWGGRNHLRSILHLCELAAKDGGYSHYHLITAQDFPIQSLDYFFELLPASSTKSYLEYFPMPADCWNEGGMDRIERFNLYDVLNAKKHHGLIQQLKKYQKKLGIKRPIAASLPPLYGGSTYWSLSHAAILKVLDHTRKQPALLKRMKHTFCSEEFYFQTILCNSELLPTLEKDNKRYIDWTERYGSNPAILDETDYEPILESKALFARKFDKKHSQSLWHQLEQHLFTNRE
ncbi:beta-1,6-N-acetylglucosaminyltransferase [Flavobacteriaceae bacterium TK19130]|nr:beta-1,6-N-acetylglucosaminyltransferase [Thermobacterium salinum]